MRIIVRMRTFAFALRLALALTLPPACAASAPARVDPAPAAVLSPAHARVRFDYHSGYLLNLHHWLYNLAVHPKQEASALHEATRPEAEALHAALAFYRAHYADSDLLFGEDMAAIKRALSVSDDARRDPHGLMLPPGLADALARAAPAYTRLAWSGDNAANRAWIVRAAELDARYGASVQARVEAALQAGFPARPVRVDLVFETGTRQGAYTDTQAVISSGRPDYQGLAALEMLYHETAHVQTSARLEEAIAARARTRGREADSELCAGARPRRLCPVRAAAGFVCGTVGRLHGRRRRRLEALPGRARILAGRDRAHGGAVAGREVDRADAKQNARGCGRK
jgi:hypothetical protein